MFLIASAQAHQWPPSKYSESLGSNVMFLKDSEQAPWQLMRIAESNSPEVNNFRS